MQQQQQQLVMMETWSMQCSCSCYERAWGEPPAAAAVARTAAAAAKLTATLNCQGLTSSSMMRSHTRERALAASATTAADAAV
jgi:hypothetical protein